MSAAGRSAVHSAYDGLQVLEAARTFRPDVIILDIDMPVMNGYQTARALRSEQAPGVRLVLIAHTGRSLPSEERASLEAGFDRHVKKPLLGQELCDLVAAYLSDLGQQASPPVEDDQRIPPPVVPEAKTRSNTELE